MAKKRTSEWKEQRSLRRNKYSKQDWLDHIYICRRDLWLKLVPAGFCLASGIVGAIAIWHKWGNETYFVAAALAVMCIAISLFYSVIMVMAMIGTRIRIKELLALPEAEPLSADLLEDLNRCYPGK